MFLGFFDTSHRLFRWRTDHTEITRERERGGQGVTEIRGHVV